MLASGQDQFPQEVAVDNENIYWTSWGTASHQFRDGTIRKISKNGGKVVDLVSNQERPTGIAVEGDQVFWVNDTKDVDRVGALMAVRKSGGTPRVVAPGGSELPVQIVSKHVYWSDGTCVFTIPNVRGERKKVFACHERMSGYGSAMDDRVTAFRVKDDSLFFLRGKPWKVALNGGEPRAIGPQGLLNQIAVSESYVYAFEFGSGDVGGAVLGRVSRHSPEATPTGFVRNLHYIRRLLVDGGQVFWSGDDGTFVQPEIAQYAAPFSSDRGRTRGLAVDAEYAYWIGGERILRSSREVCPALLARMGCPNDGCHVRTIAEVTQPGMPIAADASNFYWAATDGIYRQAASGGSSTRLAAVSGISAITVGGPRVYWATREGTGTVNSMSTDGGASTVLARRQGKPAFLAVHDPWLVWANLANGSIWKMPATGGAPERVAEDQNAMTAVVVDDEAIYWATGGKMAETGDVMSVASDGAVWRVALTGGDPVRLAQVLFPTALAIDPDRVYWSSVGAPLPDFSNKKITGSIGSISAVKKRGGPIEDIVESVNWPAGLSVDPTGLYWTSLFGGSVWWLPVGRPRQVLASHEPGPASLAVGPAGIAWLDDPNALDRKVRPSIFWPFRSKSASGQVRALAKSDFIESSLIRDAAWPPRAAHAPATSSEGPQTSGLGATSCKSGFADCDGNLSNGCEANLGYDTHHCGSCGRDCLGATCDEGICGQFSFQQHTVDSFALAAGRLFWSQHWPDEIRSAPANGVQHPWSQYGPETRDVRVIAKGEAQAILAAGEGKLFWIRPDAGDRQVGHLVAVPLSGGTPQQVSPTKWPIAGIVVVGDKVYWNDVQGDVRSLPASASPGAIPRSLAHIDGSAVGLVTDGQGLYWLESKAGVLNRLNLVNHTVGPVASGIREPRSLALEGTTLYFGEGNQDREGQGLLKRVSTSGGPVAIVASGLGLSTPCAIAADSRDIYYVDCGTHRSYSAVVWRLSKNGGPPVKLRSDGECRPPIAQDEHAVYMGCSTSLAGFSK